MRDIKKVIPKDHHVSGVEVHKSLSGDKDQYWTVRVKITHNKWETEKYGDYNKDYFVFGIKEGGLFIDDWSI